MSTGADPIVSPHVPTRVLQCMRIHVHTNVHLRLCGIEVEWSIADIGRKRIANILQVFDSFLSCSKGDDESPTLLAISYFAFACLQHRASPASRALFVRTLTEIQVCASHPLCPVYVTQCAEKLVGTTMAIIISVASI